MVHQCKRDENQKLFGIDKKQCSDHILILLENNDVKSIDYYKMISGKTYPPSEFEKLKENEKTLKGFVWREDERPLTKDDIFIKDEEITTSEINKPASKEVEKKQNSEPKKIVKPLILKEKDTVSKKVIEQAIIPKKE